MGDRAQVHLLPNDVYRRWSRMVSMAASSVVVFSPYLDLPARRLFKRHGLASDSDFTVVTDLTPAHSGGAALKQLHTLKWLLEAGATVLHLPRLHAKVLLVDDADVAIGSQNFTEYARSSREATVTRTGAPLPQALLSTLRQWVVDAEPIDAVLVDELIARTSAELDAAAKAEQALRTAVESVLASWRSSKSDFYTPLLAEQPSVQQWRAPQGVALLEFRSAGSYDSLLVSGRHRDLTMWLTAGQREFRLLEVLKMYPIVLAHSGRMAFARLATTRITYFRQRVNPAGAIWCGDTPVWVTVDFPANPAVSGNVELTLRDSPEFPVNEMVVRARFNGAEFDILTVHTTKESRTGPDAFAAIVTSAMGDVELAGNLFREVLEPFKYERLGIEDKNAHEFVSFGDWYALDVLEYRGQAVLRLTCA